MPSNLDDFNDIENVADEFDIKKIETDETNEEDTQKPETFEQQTTESDPLLTENKNHINDEHASIDDIANQNIFSSTADKNDLREIRSTAGYEQTNENILLPSAESNIVDSIKKESQRSDIDEVERIFDDDYTSEEDYAVESDGIKVARKNAMRLHTSYQKTSVREPLLQQGFIASPGYPSYYVGSSNCSWLITAPRDQRIRLTFFDINLRCKFSCSY